MPAAVNNPSWAGPACSTSTAVSGMASTDAWSPSNETNWPTKNRRKSRSRNTCGPFMVLSP